jgi:hypothetical protein
MDPARTLQLVRWRGGKDNAIYHTVCNIEALGRDPYPNRPFRTSKRHLRGNSQSRALLVHLQPTFRQLEARLPQ